MTFKSLAADGKIKKGDKFRVRITDILEEPGFNLREENSELESHIESMCTSYMAGVNLPPLEVRLTVDDKIYVVDGHCRRRAILKAIERGAQIEFVDVLPFAGNDVDRVAKMIASSQGLALKPLERAIGYKRLVNFGWDAEQIALHVGMTKPHVEQLLVLANANHDVQRFVSEGKIAAHTAIDIVRKHGENAGAFIQAQIDAATHKGKARITKGSMAGKSLPKKVVNGVLDSFKVFSSRVSPSMVEHYSAMRELPAEELAAKTVEIDALSLVELMKAKEVVDAAMAKSAHLQ